MPIFLTTGFRIPEVLLTVILPLAISVLGAVIAITVHEYIKALVSTRLGDPTPKKYGKLSINPLKHVDLLGLIFLVSWNAGWSDPVQTSPVYYDDRKKGILLTYIVPILFNLLLGMGLAFTAKLLGRSDMFHATILRDGTPVLMSSLGSILLALLLTTAFYNVQFALVSLLPIYPLDGARILSAFQSPSTTVKMHQYQGILQLVLFFLIWSNVISRILTPITLFLLGMN